MGKKAKASNNAAADFDVAPPSNTEPAPDPEVTAALPAENQTDPARPAEPAKKFNPGADHVHQPLDARTLQDTWARQNENIRTMRLENLARHDTDVRWLMDQLNAANEKLAKLEAE